MSVSKKIKKLEKKAKKIKKKIIEVKPKVVENFGLLEILLEEAKISLPKFYETMEWSRGRSHYYLASESFLPVKHQKELQRRLKLPPEVWERVYKRFVQGIFS